ncbi:RmuC-domain protein [Candidatus Zixiibacteriota bacterium]|nr:RmuC-domain protein [candidate division Zixibacteria bacterium]
MEILLIIITAVVSIALSTFVVVRIFSRRIENNVLAKMEDSFSRASLEAISKNSEQFLKWAKELLSKETEGNVRELNGKKELIDNTLQQMKLEMGKVQEMITAFEKDRDLKFGAISKGLENHSQQTARLQEITQNLSRILADPRQRGIWGQKIAEDILQMIGMQEGINYHQQKGMAIAPGRPDFTFLLPNKKIINMDVKFPLDNFRRYIEETNEPSRQGYKTQFLKDARTMVKQVTTRDYINTDADTLDYAIVFIPLEQAYTFIMEQDGNFMDDALRSRVIVCSPWTLYAMLAVIRQSIDNFNLERSANRILELMTAFYKQWNNYVTEMDKMGKKIDDLHGVFNNLVTTRRNQLERPLQQIDQLYRQRHPAESSDELQPAALPDGSRQNSKKSEEDF